MMMSKTRDDRRALLVKKLLIPMLCGGVAGFLLVVGVFSFAEGIGETGLTASAEVAVLTGAFYVLLGTFVGAGTLMPKAGSRLLNVEDEDEIREMRSMLLLSSYAMALWGVALVVLALSGPDALVASGVALAIAGVCYAAGSYLGLRSYANSDELMLAVNRESAIWSLTLVFAVLGGWGAGAHAGFLDPPGGLDILTAFYITSLIAAFIAAGRRGMLNIR
jgi:hypothetical protein